MKENKIKLPCPACGSANTIKAGINYQSKRQKMLCKSCGHIFQDGSIDKKGEGSPQSKEGELHE